MDERTFPDVAPFLAAKARQRRQLAALSWEEKVALIEQMRELMPRHAWRKNQSMPEDAAGRLRHYRAIIKDVLVNYAQAGVLSSATDDRSERLPIFDERQDIYLVQCMRWKHDKCEFTTPLRLRIKENQVWIEADESQDGMMAALTQAGISPADLVERLR